MNLVDVQGAIDDYSRRAKSGDVIAIDVGSSILQSRVDYGDRAGVVVVEYLTRNDAEAVVDAGLGVLSRYGDPIRGTADESDTYSVAFDSSTRIGLADCMIDVLNVLQQDGDREMRLHSWDVPESNDHGAGNKWPLSSMLVVALLVVIALIAAARGF